MINYLNGILQFVSEDYIILDVNNIGLKIHIPTTVTKQLPAVNEKVKILTYLHIRENDFSLYGFIDSFQVDMFKLLLSVSGIGPKVAINTLSFFTPQKLSESIISNNINALTAIPGVGKKTAKKIIFELKDKITEKYEILKSSTEISSDKLLEAINALEILGYPPAISMETIRSLDIDMKSLNIEDIVKHVLKQIDRQI